MLSGKLKDDKNFNEATYLSCHPDTMNEILRNNQSTNNIKQKITVKEQVMKNKKPPLIERICKAIDIPPESVSHTPCIELHGRSLLKIRDGGKILLYTHEKIKIELPKSSGTLTVQGNELSCAFYNLGAIGINGHIDTVSFVDKEE